MSADTATPLFGHPVTVTASVAAADPEAPTPTGTVTFSDGTVPLATVPLTDGRASFTTAAFQPGSHPITATYGGDLGHAPSSAPAADVTVGFSTPCLTAAHHGPLTVASGDALCLAADATQDGPVTVRPGGALAVSGAEIHGKLSADGALALTICRSTLAGAVTVHGSSGLVRIGSAVEADGCAGNEIHGRLTVDAGTGGVDVAGNTVTGPVEITGNSGAVAVAEANTVTGPLRCEGNTPDLRQADNTTTGPRTGQCR
ncbi:Ig-like domain-containing protein [Kitasatospora sp. NPDC057904]|uniref:Ig-like domain-containing protein n=1 Tax=unclassified Kitasatospora TaxID=2633591 RepID=UPI0036DD23F3